MTRPNSENGYAGAERLLCKGASQGADTNAPAVKAASSPAQRPSGSVLHGRDDEPSKRANRDQAISSGRTGGHAPVRHQQHPEAVTRQLDRGPTERSGHRRHVLLDLPGVRERGVRPETRLSRGSVCGSDAAGVRRRNDETDPGFVAVPVDRPDYPSSPTELPEAYRHLVEARLNSPEDDCFSRFEDWEIDRQLAQLPPHKPFIPPYGPQKEWTEDELREQLAARQRKGGWS